MDTGTGAAIGLGVTLGALLLFGIVFGIIAAKAGVIEDPEKSIKIKQYLSELFSYGFGGVDLVSILTTHFIFLAGPIIDFINQSFQYSIASIVGFLNVILVSILGSTRFAELSKSILGGIFPGGDPTRTWSTWSYNVFTNWKTWLYLIPAIALLFVPAGMLSISNNSASYTAIGIGALAIITYVFMPLASAGYLGYISGDITYGPEEYPNPFGDATPFTGGGLKIDPEYGFCELPGFSYFQNALAPVSVVLSQTVLWCHIAEMIYNNNQNTTSSIILSTVLLLAQWITLYNKGCFVAYRSGRAAPLVGLGLSVAAGFLAYYIIGQMNSTSDGPLILHVNTESFTSSSSEGGVFHPPPKPASKTPSKSLDKKIVVGPQTETSEPVDDQDAFVCEAYKDGELVTSTIVD